MSEAAVVRRLMIVGNAGGTNVGDSLHRAALRLGVETRLLDARRAFEGPAWYRHVTWRLLGHRPPGLSRFSALVTQEASRFKPDCLVTTGLAPVTAQALALLASQGIRRVHYSTDDPWNATQRSAWFLRSLAQYDAVFTTRRSNLADLRGATGATVRYLPFGYDPALFFPEALPESERRQLHAEVLFVGGADADRARAVEGLHRSGVGIALHGDYWSRFASLRAASRGHASPETVRKATLAADVNLCLVRRANRDGHVMRTFEAAACGACMLVEDTPEHRELFGPDFACVAYFDSVDSLSERLQALLRDPALRRRLGGAVQVRIAGGAHTYGDRLKALLGGPSPWE